MLKLALYHPYCYQLSQDELQGEIELALIAFDTLHFARDLQLLVLAVLFLVASVSSQAWIDEDGNYFVGKPKCTKYKRVSCKNRKPP